MWKKYDDPRPYSSMAGIVVDASGRFPIMHRSKLVRSVRDCWSLPTGNHELDTSMADQLCVEMLEELNVCVRTDVAPVPICWYDNVVKEGESWWHWVMHVYVVRTDDLSQLVNKEPGKHDEIRIVTWDVLKAMIANGERFAPNHAKNLIANESRILSAIQAMTAGVDTVNQELR